MKKVIKTIIALLVVIAVIPSLAGLAITPLWNSIIATTCGFPEICFWQGTGLFLLGQIMTGGFIFLFLFVGGIMHKIHHHTDDWHSHWHNMTREQKREFIERRRREHFGLRNHKTADSDATE